MRYLLGFVFIAFSFFVNAQSFSLFKDSIKQKFASEFSFSEIKNVEDYNIPLKPYSDNILSTKSLRLTGKQHKTKYATIFIYNFKTDSLAADFVKQIIEGVKKNDNILFKDYDYLILSDNNVIRVDGSCVFSKDAWNSFIDEFINVTQIFYENIEKRLQVFCGGEALTYEISEIKFKPLQVNAHQNN